MAMTVYGEENDSVGVPAGWVYILIHPRFSHDVSKRQLIPEKKGAENAIATQ